LTHEGVYQENAPQTQNGWAIILDGLQSSIDSLTILRITRQFNAQPSRVFDAWTDPKVASKWLFTAPTSERHEMQAELRVGGKWTVIDRREGVDYTALGEYLGLDRPRRLVFTFGMPQFSPGFAKVTVEMRPEGDGTLMTLTHEKVPGIAVSETEKGWGAMLDRLPAFL
jgi:uncharacterized protein YndB with AHSA1/START domain